MKALPLVFAAIMPMAAPVRSQVAATSVPSDPVGAASDVPADTAIVGPLADGTPPQTVAKPAPIDFKVRNTITKRMRVVEAPEISGLPMVTGTITTTVQLVEDPDLPIPPPALPALRVTDPAVLARMREMRAKYVATRIAFVSATVYDHSRTYLKAYANGNPQHEICAWSNLDFMCFSGFGTYQVLGRDDQTRKYALLMGIGAEDTRQRGALLAKHGKSYVPPTVPVLPDLSVGGPAFVITAGDAANPESLALIEGMHDLYRAEGPRMEAAYVARVQAHEARKAYLLANPAVPQDVTIQYWSSNVRPQSANESKGATP